MAALAQIPLDPTGLLARTVLVTGEVKPTKNAVYPTRAAMHFQSDPPVASKKLFADTGVTAVAMGQANVYQSRDSQTAQAITKGFDNEVLLQGAKPADQVPALPQSHCAARPKASTAWHRPASTRSRRTVSRCPKPSSWWLPSTCCSPRSEGYRIARPVMAREITRR